MALPKIIANHLMGQKKCQERMVLGPTIPCPARSRTRPAPAPAPFTAAPLAEEFAATLGAGGPGGSGAATVGKAGDESQPVR